jgi:hypothetical protein
LCELQTARLQAALGGEDPAADSADLPASADLHPQFDRLGLVRRVQDARGTCSVFTMAGALEFAAAKQAGHGQILSVEFLNWAANQSRPPRDGGIFSDMWKGFAAHGICAERLMPYQPIFDPARVPEPEAIQDAHARMKAGLRHHWIKRWNVTTGLTEDQLTAIKRTVAGGWPVCGGFRWPNNPIWVEGVLQMCPSTNVFDGHSVLLVGFKDEPAQAGGGVFLFRNSNANVDGSMPYAYAQAYMNDALWIDFATNESAANPPAPQKPTENNPKNRLDEDVRSK